MFCAVKAAPHVHVGRGDWGGLGFPTFLKPVVLNWISVDSNIVWYSGVIHATLHSAVMFMICRDVYQN